MLERLTDGSQQTSFNMSMGRERIRYVHLLCPECLTQSKLLYLSLKFSFMLNYLVGNSIIIFDLFK